MVLYCIPITQTSFSSSYTERRKNGSRLASFLVCGFVIVFEDFGHPKPKTLHGARQQEPGEGSSSVCSMVAVFLVPM